MNYWIALFLLLGSLGEACTAFHLRSEDQALIYCRSLEFGMAFDSNLLIVPRETNYTATAPNGKKGLSWKTRYGFVGMNQVLDRKIVSDGMNEKGLVVGMLYLPGYAKYEPDHLEKIERSLGAWELGTFLLSLCSSVEDAKKLLPTVVVTNAPTPGVNAPLPLHFYIGDSSGKVLIVEYINGERKMHDNPMGVLTNSPPFDWQITNLSNFVNLSPFNAPAIKVGPSIIQNFGQGTGALGIPGDYTPSSRFVRASLYTNWASLQKNALDTVRLGFHLLNTFDIFEGAIQEKGKTATDITEWVIVHDQTNLKTYFRTYESLKIQMVDLQQIDFKAPKPKEIPIAKEFIVENISPTSS